MYVWVGTSTLILVVILTCTQWHNPKSEAVKIDPFFTRMRTLNNAYSVYNNNNNF